MSSAFSIPPEINHLLRQKCNSFCVDCFDSCSLFIDIDNCVFLCQNCSDIHKELGFQIKNPLYDNFTRNEIENLKNADNEKFNQNYLALYQQNSTQIPFGASYQDRKSFITEKYVVKKWFSKIQTKNNQSFYNHRHIEIQESEETSNNDDNELFNTTSESSESSEIASPADLNFFGLTQKVNQIIDTNEEIMPGPNQFDGEFEIQTQYDDEDEESQKEFENDKVVDLGDDDNRRSGSLIDVTSGLGVINDNGYSAFDGGDNNGNQISNIRRKKKKSVFDNDADQLFGVKHRKTSGMLFDDDSNNNKVVPPSSKKASGGLFDDDSNNNKVVPPSSSRASSGLFNDDLFKRKSRYQRSENPSTFGKNDSKSKSYVTDKLDNLLTKSDSLSKKETNMIHHQNEFTNSRSKNEKSKIKLSEFQKEKSNNVKNIIILCFAITFVLAVFFIIFKFRN